MISLKSSNFQGMEKINDEYLRDIDSDLRSLFLLTQGRISFGDGVDGNRGENIDGEFQVFTSHATANTEFSVAHTLGVVPIGYIVMGQDKAGSLYQLSGTGTAWTSTTIYFKCDATSVQFRVFLIK